MGNAKRKKIAILSPYLDILGGGERFLLTIAQYLSKRNKVTIFWNNSQLIHKANKKLGIDLTKIKIEKIPVNSFCLFVKLLNFDTLFYMTDGSLFFTPCSKNFLIIQSPAHIPKNNLINNIKLSQFKSIICYSQFVANFIKKKLNKKTQIIPPPVLTEKFKPIKKEKLIISVGRFFPYLHSKKQDILVSAFRKFYQNHRDWQLILIGSVDKGGETYLEKIKKEASDLPVKIITSCSLDLLASFYGKAKIYWHATGFGENLLKYPERAEHFGITTIEAMSAGCVPIVFTAGGQTEIIKDGVNGFFWNQIAQLIDKTERLATNENLFNTLSARAHQDSRIYAKDKFIQKIEKIINND